MPPKHQIFIDDVKFIFAEADRLRGLGLKNVPFEERMIDIPHPELGHMLIGKEGSKRLWKLADELGLRSGILSRIENRALYKVMGAVLVERLHPHIDTLDQSKFDKAMNEGIRRLKKTCVDRVHYIPCHLMWTKDPSTLTIGPVTFHNRASFRRLLMSKKALQSSYEPSAQRQHSRQLLADTFRFYRKFRWVAEVDVKGFDEKTSEKMAERAVTSALDCLHIFLSPEHTAGMQVGGPATHWERRASLCIDEKGELWASTSALAVGQVNFGDGWSKSLEGDDTRHRFKLFSTAVETVIDPDLKRPLCRRFLDAAQWFGEAVRDERASTSVVKYVMAIERMMMTDADKGKSDSGKESITSNIANRVSALCFDPRIPGDRDNWRKKVVDAYDLRSKLVHGSMSPLDKEAEKNRWSIGEIARFALLQAIEAFDVQGLKRDDINGEELRDWFGKVVEWADRAEKHVWPEEPCPTRCSETVSP